VGLTEVSTSIVGLCYRPREATSDSSGHAMVPVTLSTQLTMAFKAQIFSTAKDPPT
jgi:hypothetical protein